ncbi:MAG: alpha/beta hydrolase domain-containing protein [Holophaga sp.]|nr:alpha/beta hydrolase domain-containing protein [Holophaga sp.]
MNYPIARLTRQTAVNIGASAVLALGFAACSSGSHNSAEAAADKQTVLVPTATLVPQTASSIAFNANAMKYNPIDLTGYGYVEGEYFMSGTANVYNWADTSKAATVATAGAPYVTEFMIVYPSDMSKFSGNVLIEVGNATAGYDKPNFYDTAWHQVLLNHDAYIEMVSQAGPVAKLKQYDSARYASLSWQSPADSTKTENGLFWDMFSQAAAWVRSSSSSNPLAGHVKTVIATGTSQSSVYLNTYINAVLPLAKKTDGGYIFDGVVQSVGPNYYPINGSASAPYSFPSRGIVPIIRFASCADFANMMGPSDNPPISSRRADSDTPGDQYRLYEIAGMPHNSVWMNLYGPNWTQLAKVGVSQTTSNTSDITFTAKTNDFPGYAFVQGGIVNMENWINKGVAPPKDLPRLNYEAMYGVEKLEYETDTYGNPKGGVRNPYVDVPYATWVPHNYEDTTLSSTSQFTRCYKTLFDSTTLSSLYSSTADFTTKFNAGIDSLVKERMISDSDALELKNRAGELQILAN